MGVAHGSSRIAGALAAATLIWTLAAFGGAFRWTYVPAMGALAASVILLRPAVAPSGMRAVDGGLICALIWGAFQTMPLPASLLARLSPRAQATADALRFQGAAPAHTLSLNPAATAEALVVSAMAVAMFWTTRELCARRGPRELIRAIAWAGLAIAIVAVAAVSAAPTRLYAIWDAGERTHPFGPFVNRNHMATWLVMAVLLVVGYTVSRIQGRRRSHVSAVDAPMVWLGGAIAAMLIDIVASQSRSAVLGLIAGALCVAAAALTSRRRTARWAVLAIAIAAAAIVATSPRIGDLARRFEDSGTTETWSRGTIWRETLPVMQDFPATGVGLGSYGTAMLVYQQSDRQLFFNQAHNQYLQLASEGGVVLVVVLGIAAVALSAAIAHRIRQDVERSSRMFWIRVGAVAGIVGVLVQSVWETGLRLPANGLLFATLCAIAAHKDHR
jgi:O-antigen ligase